MAKHDRGPRARTAPAHRTLHLGLGTLYRHTAKRQPAHEHLTTATTMFHEMEMEFWLEKTAAEMAAVH